MKKICGMAIIAIIVCVCCSQTISAIEITLPEEITIDYNGHRVDVTFDGDIELTYVYSYIDLDALTWEIRTEYNSTVDQVIYSFWSEEYFPEYWEVLDQELFIFQDDNSSELFVLKINMSDIEIPEDPWKIEYLNMSSEYNKTYQELNIAIYNLTRIKEKLDELIITHMGTFQELNTTLAQKENLTNLLISKSSEINGLKNDLDSTNKTRDSALVNATVFRRFFNEMTSYKSEFDFKLAGRTEEYTTIYKYEHKIDKLEDQVSGFPLLIFFFVAITMIICLMTGYWRWAKKRSSPEEVEMLEGVDLTTTFVNRFKARIGMKPKNVKIKEKEVTKEEEHEYLEKIVDKKLEAFETKIGTKIDTGQNLIMEKLGKLDELMGIKAKPEKKKE